MVLPPSLTQDTGWLSQPSLSQYQLTYLRTNATSECLHSMNICIVFINQLSQWPQITYKVARAERSVCRKCKCGPGKDRWKGVKWSVTTEVCEAIMSDCYFYPCSFVYNWTPCNLRHVARVQPEVSGQGGEEFVLQLKLFSSSKYKIDLHYSTTTQIVSVLFYQYRKTPSYIVSFLYCVHHISICGILWDCGMPTRCRCWLKGGWANKCRVRW